MPEGFPQILCRLRKERRLNQRTAAAALGISQALLSHYENGLREPGLSFVDAACRYYGVSADYLLGRSPVRSSLASEKLTPALFRLTELGAASLLALVKGLAGAGDACVEDWEGLLSVFLYSLFRNFDGTSEFQLPGELAEPLSAAALGLLRARLLSDGKEEALAFTVPDAVKKQAEELLCSLQAEWQ